MRFSDNERNIDNEYLRRLRSNSNWSSLKWMYHSAHIYTIVTPHCVCVSLVMVWGIMSPVSCVTQISFYRSTLSGRNTYTLIYTHTHIHTSTCHTLTLLSCCVFLSLLFFFDTLSSHSSFSLVLSPCFLHSFCLSHMKRVKRKRVTKLVCSAGFSFPHMSLWFDLTLT